MKRDNLAMSIMFGIGVPLFILGAVVEGSLFLSTREISGLITAIAYTVTGGNLAAMEYLYARKAAEK